MAFTLISVFSESYCSGTLGFYHGLAKWEEVYL